MTASKGSLDVPTLEGWLWDAACQIRGRLDAPKYKDYILPLVLLKRLSDVCEDEIEWLAQLKAPWLPSLSCLRTLLA